MIRTLAYFKCSLVIPSSPGALRTLSETSVSLYLPLLYYNIEFLSNAVYWSLMSD